MKILFFNADGTIKRKLVVSIVAVITIFIAAISLIDDIQAVMYNMQVEKKKNTTTTTFNLCRDCDIKFKKDIVDVEVGDSISINDLIKLTNINIMNVKFSISDTEMLKLNSKGKEINIDALNKAGTAVVTATYHDRSATIRINVTYKEIKHAYLIDHEYQVALGDKDYVLVDTDPLGVDLNDLNLSIKDTSVAYLDSDKRIIPVKLGTTEIVLDFKGQISTRKLSVVKNRIKVYALKNNSYQEVFELNSDTLGDEFDIVIEFQDNLGEGYIKDDLKFEIQNVGMVTEVEYNGINLEKERFYNFKVKVSEKDGTLPEMYSIIKMSLPDGSSTDIKVIG